MITSGSPLDPPALLAVAPSPLLDDALWRFDGVALALLVLVLGIAAAVLPFAHRSLRGDRHGTAITAALGAMLLTTAWLAIAGPLWMLGLAWSASTVATLIALGLGGGVRALLPGAVWLVAADLALWAAIVLTSIGGGASTDAAALLLVVAAALRCALPPAQSWLVGSLYAPTPVSAALHGGIVNGGGILVITQLPLIGESLLATVVLALLAGLGLLLGVAASLTRTDVKGRLVMSTVAQMGFMLLCAALGLAAAALVHLVAHGLYKSSLFLSSSDGIDRRAYDRRAPALVTLSRRRAAAQAAGALLPVLSLTSVALAVYPGGRGFPELLLLIVIGAAFAAAGSRAARLAPSTALAAASAALLAGAAAAYALLASLLTVALEPPSPTAAQPAVVALAVLTLSLVVALGMMRRWFPMSRPALAVQALGLGVGEPTAARLASRASSPPRVSVPDRHLSPLTTGAPS